LAAESLPPRRIAIGCSVAEEEDGGLWSVGGGRFRVRRLNRLLCPLSTVHCPLLGSPLGGFGADQAALVGGEVQVRVDQNRRRGDLAEPGGIHPARRFPGAQVVPLERLSCRVDE